MKKQLAAFAAAMTMTAAVHAEEGSWTVFAGVDYVSHEVSLTVPVPPPEGGKTGGTRRISGDGGSILVKGGLWLNEDFAVELQGSVSSDEVDGTDSAEIDSYVGLYFKPRAQVFDWMDMYFPIGFSMIDAIVFDEVDGVNVEASNDAVSFGFEMNFRVGEMIADEDSILAGLGVGLGFMVYNSSDNASVRGYTGGLSFALDF